MAVINTDTKELYIIGDNIIKLSKELDEKLNELFKRIDSVPTITLEWVGGSSNQFVELSKIDRVKYYKFVDDIRIYGNFLCETSDSIENKSYPIGNH